MNSKKIETSLREVRHPLSRERHQTILIGESMTHQSHRDLCDINNVIKRFENTGEMPQGTREAQYGDVTNLQQNDLTERIQQSREILHKAGEYLEAKTIADLQREKSRQIDLEAEIKRLKEENQTLTASKTQ